MITGLTQFSNMPKEPQLGDIEKRKKDNEEYNTPLKNSLDEQKASLLASLYGKKESEQPATIEQDLEQEQNRIEQERKIDEHPDTPLIDSFVKEGNLEETEGELIKSALIEGKQIKDLKIIDEEKRNELINSIPKHTPEECLEKFSNDFQTEIEGLKQQVEGGKKGEKKLQGENEKLVNLIGKNYFNLSQGKEGKESNKDALDRAIKTTVNKIMDGKQFYRPETFNDMLDIVRNSELGFEERFNELKAVDKLINISQGKGGKKDKETSDKIKAGVEKQKSALEIKFSEFKKQVKIAKEAGNKEKAEELLIEAQGIKEEADASGDIFVSTDIDTLTNNLKDLIEYT